MENPVLSGTGGLRTLAFPLERIGSYVLAGESLGTR